MRWITEAATGKVYLNKFLGRAFALELILAYNPRYW